MKRAVRFLPAILVLLWTAPVWAAGAEGEAAEKFLGLPVGLWKTVNLLLLLGLLVKLMGKPFNEFFRNRTSQLHERLDQAIADREEAVRLAAEMKTRLDRLEGEIAEVRRRAVEEGEAQKAEQLAAAERDAEALRRSAAEEIDRRMEAARVELARAAADLAARQASEIVARSIGPEDHRRLFDENVERLGKAS